MDTGNSDILLLERSLKINHKIKILSGECKSSSCLAATHKKGNAVRMILMELT